MKKIVVATTKKEINSVINMVLSNPSISYVIDSFCVIDQDELNININSFVIKTNKDNFISYVCHNWVDEILIATKSDNVPSNIYDDLRQMGITINIISENENTNNKQIKKLYGYKVNRESGVKTNIIKKIIKRIIDIIGGTIGCLLTIILIIIIGPIIYIKSPGPIIFKQKRVGLNGRIFTMYKFRSMSIDAEVLKENLKHLNTYDSDLMFKIQNDPRLIPNIGKFLRKSMIDEFPQFFNVLLGDMSLVGTRPPTLDEWNKYEPKHRIRMTIKPGITGLWQIYSSPNNRSFDKVVEYDKEYIKNWSLNLDTKIIIKTVLRLFKIK